MKKIIALILVGCFVFSSVVAQAATNSGEVSAKITAKLNKPISEVLDPNGIVSKFLGSSSVTCDVKYDFSNDASLKMQVDMTADLPVSVANIPTHLTEWLNINAANSGYATMTTIIKVDNNDKYIYETTLLTKEQASQLVGCLKAVNLINDKTFLRQYVTLLQNYGATKNQNTINVTFSPKNLFKFYDDIMNLYQKEVPGFSLDNYISTTASVSGDSADAQQMQDEIKGYLNTMKSVAQSKLFANDALTMNLTLSDSGNSIVSEKESIHLKFNAYDVISSLASAMGQNITQEDLPFTRADSDFDITLDCESNMVNIGSTTITEPTLTADNSMSTQQAAYTTYSSYTDSGYNDISLTDISDCWAQSDINDLVSAGVLSGNDDGTFAPNSYMTRGMLVTALDYLNNNDEYYEASAGSFSDLTDDDYFASSAIWAVKHNIIAASDTFNGNQPITREEMCVILKNYADYTGIDLSKGLIAAPNFGDQDQIASYAKDAVDLMYENGIIAGNEDGLFRPTSPTTRAEAAHILNTFYQKFVAKN